MEARRKKGILGGGFMVIIIAFFVGDEFYNRFPARHEALGVITGVFIGLLICIYASRFWDSANLVFGPPSTPAIEERNWRLLPWTMALAAAFSGVGGLTGAGAYAAVRAVGNPTAAMFGGGIIGFMTANFVPPVSAMKRQLVR